ncbi:hypothetical protein D6C79_00966 [Aureobasidium pullulans]|nr:hypothetical protein D6C79_00966 [Aureobasidium pullulans]
MPGIITQPSTLSVPHDPSELPPGSDPFLITAQNGYLPTQLPLRRLPKAFDALSDILDDMPILKEDGTAGLLATFKLGPLIDSGALPDLTHEIDNLVVEGGEVDMAAITAAFRDYSLDIPAFMSYAASYALYNYYLVDPSKGHDDYSNIRLIRAFEKGLDPKSSEAGFILTHIHMVAQTGKLIEGAAGVVEAVDAARSDKKDDHAIPDAKVGLQSILQAMTVIEANMEKMWANSLPKDYMTYRTFIYGITNQSMFPDGVVYEGQYDDKPQFFRGESGANDSIIPLLDHVCEIPMPENPLTQILREFRQYRPKPHREFLTTIREKAADVGVRDFLTNSGDLSLVVLYLRVLDHIRSFRWRHWQFTREYIIKRTSHPVATGGSPIITWLPNQLSAVMQLMEDVCKGSGLWAVLAEGVWSGGGAAASLTKKEFELIKDIMDNAVDQKEKLAKEVAKYCQDRGVDASKV